MNRRIMLAFGAVAVAALLVILVVALQTDNSATEPPASPEPTADEPGSGSGGVRGRAVARRDGARPSSSGEKSYREYVREDGTRVRDHRKFPREPVDRPKPPPPPKREGRQLPTTITRDLNGKLRDVVRACAASIPAEARGTRPRVEGTITVAIKDHQLAVTGTTVGLKDVTGDMSNVQQCFQQKAAGLAGAAAGEADIEGYEIRLSLAIPKARS